jgi:hypothetical protein
VPVRYEAGAQNFFSGIGASRSIDSHCHQLIKYAYLAPNSPSPDHMRTLGRSSVNIFSYMWVPHLFCRHRYVVGSVPIFSQGIAGEVSIFLCPGHRSRCGRSDLSMLLLLGLVFRSSQRLAFRWCS